MCCYNTCMLSSARNVAGGLEEGLEGGIWGGIKGALLGYFTLPIVASVAAVAIGMLSGGMTAAPAALLGAGVFAATAVLAYPLNKQVAKFGGLLGGVIGFAGGVDEPEGKTIQLAPGQDVVVVNGPAMMANQETAPTATHTPDPHIKSELAELQARLSQKTHTTKQV